MSEEKKGSLELNWINKDKSLLYEYDEDGEPYRPEKWVDKRHIKISEPRNLQLVEKIGDRRGPNQDNRLIKGDNLLALKSLVEEFKDRPKSDKVKCIYIDPPFNIDVAFENYEDNFEHSEWLTFMRDRLILLKKLLREDGSIFIHIDNAEIDYLKVLTDEVFGRDNFINRITVAATSPSSFKTVNPGVFDEAEYILHYAKDKEQWNDKTLYVPAEYDNNYNKIILNPSDPIEEWNISSVKKEFLEEYNSDRVDEIKEFCEEVWKKCNDLPPRKIKSFIKHHFKYANEINVDTVGNQFRSKFRNDIEKQDFIEWCFWYLLKKISYYGKEDLHDFVIENADRVFRYGEISDSGAGKKTVETKKVSLDNPKEFFVVERDEYEDVVIKDGKEIIFYDNKVREIEGKKTTTKILSNIWTDIAWEGIAKEGGVKLKKGKKPEKLVKRILKIGTEKNDIVMDSFLGSGTTAAVAHKMNRRWIGIELIPDQFEKALKRLKWVVDIENPDTTGISEDPDVDWEGGGNFSIFEIGDSILSDENEINWSHSSEELAKSAFWMFDYSFKGQLENENDFEIYLGKKKEKFAFSIISEKAGIIRKEKLDEILEQFKEKFGPNKEVEIYTNYGIGVDEKDLPENLTIRKVPDCILEKYKLGEE